MKISAKVTDHIGDIALGADPKAAVNGIVSSIVNEAISTVTSQAASLVNESINNTLNEVLDNSILNGAISGNIDAIKYRLVDAVNQKMRQTISNVIPDDIEYMSNNIGSIQQELSYTLQDIQSQIIPTVLGEFASDIPDVSSLTSQISNSLTSVAQNQINGAINTFAANAGKSVQDAISGGLDSILGKDLATQLGGQAASEVMNAINGFKVVVGSGLNRSIVNQGSILIGAGSKLTSLLPDSISLGSGAGLLKLGAGLITMGAGSKKVSIGDGDIKIGGSSIAPSDDLPQNLTPLPQPGQANSTSRADHSHQFPLASISRTLSAADTLNMNDHGHVVEWNGNSANLTLPNDLPVGFNCLVRVIHASGIPTFTAASGTIIRQADSLTKARKQWSEVSVSIRANSDGASAEYVLSGDLA